MSGAACLDQALCRAALVVQRCHHTMALRQLLDHSSMRLQQQLTNLASCLQCNQSTFLICHLPSKQVCICHANNRKGAVLHHRTFASSLLLQYMPLSASCFVLVCVFAVSSLYAGVLKAASAPWTQLNASLSGQTAVCFPHIECHSQAVLPHKETAGCTASCHSCLRRPGCNTGRLASHLSSMLAA